VQLLAVTTVFGNAGVDVTTVNALRVRALGGLGQLPVAAGAARPLAYPRRECTACWHGETASAGGLIRYRHHAGRSIRSAP
jgi:inosine-uridine nucleoside N-ribohydrolase